MSEVLRKLNLGCGDFRKEGFVNVDGCAQFKPDVLHDLDRVPYPLPSDHFSLVEADHVLEHLHDPFAVMKEIHRILKEDGKLIIRVPHFSRGMTHADHKRGFDVTFPYYFNPSFTAGYMGVRFQLEKLSLTWFAQPYLKKKVLPKSAYYFGSIFGKGVDFFANLSPIICSRLWCFMVGGFEEIEFRFTCKK